jgi:REP element-mobilizing transposase RayT
MSLPQRKWLHHTPPPWAGDSTYFITVGCETRGTNQLCTAAASSALLSAVQHYHDALRWHVTVWLLMPDHLHALLSCPREEDLAKSIASWKRFTARACGIIWQKGFFDHRLRSDESLEEKSHYIRLNPVRKGLIAQPEDWPHLWPRDRTSP